MTIYKTAAGPMYMSRSQKRSIHTAVRETLTARFMRFDDESGDQLEANLQAFLADIDAAAIRHSAKAPKLFSSAPPTYALGAVAQKRTQDCFTSKLWYYRDRDFDNWLPADQSNTDTGSITVLTPEKDWTFVEAAVSVLNVSPDTSVDVLGRLLKERRHTITLTQLEAITEATERGDKTGMVTNSFGNFAFMENEDGSVSVADVRRRGGDRPWYAVVRELARSYRGYADDRLLVCNLDPSKLGL